MKKNVILEAPAKINLTLNVLEKRSDGFHELETVMQQISLHDKIFLEADGKGINVNSNSELIPDNADNLAYQAAHLLYTQFSIQLGLQIYIEKKIPVGAGLAGGSTDAAAVMLGTNEMFDLGLSITELQELGLKIGSDVPFCIGGGTALARGRGEKLTPLPPGPSLEMVLIKPDFQLSTAEVYRALRLEAIREAPDNTAFLEAWRKCDIIGIGQQMKNVLELVSIERCPEIAVIKTKLADLGALTAFMSGSGPTVVGVFMTREEAWSAWQKLKDQYRESYQVSSYRRGDQNAGKTVKPG